MTLKYCHFYSKSVIIKKKIHNKNVNLGSKVFSMFPSIAGLQKSAFVQQNFRVLSQAENSKQNGFFPKTS